MLRQAKDFKKLKLRAKDEDIGHAEEFYFDDRFWTVRYLVANTGGWLTGRQVLISPYALKPVDQIDVVLPVELTKNQIEKSPSLDFDQPVSRQFESKYYDYYGWPYYWYGDYSWGTSPYIPIARTQVEEIPGKEETWDPNLRSTKDVSGYDIQALDGGIGHVEDFILDDETWSIRYLVIDTKNWWPGKRVLVAPEWIEKVSWAESKVFVNLKREEIKEAPEYSPETFNRDYESSLHQHYEKEGYWQEANYSKK